MSKILTRLFDDYSDATKAVNGLGAIGIREDDISIVANNANGEHGANGANGGINEDGDVTKGTSAGAALGGAGGLLAGLGLLAIPGLGPIVAAGWLAATAAGAAIGAIGGAATGGIVGALKNAGHSDEEANVYSEGVRRGGTLVSVKAPDEYVAAAEAVLDGNRPVDAERRGIDYRSGGWERFDPEAPVPTAATRFSAIARPIATHLVASNGGSAAAMRPTSISRISADASLAWAAKTSARSRLRWITPKAVTSVHQASSAQCVFDNLAHLVRACSRRLASRLIRPDLFGASG